MNILLANQSTAYLNSVRQKVGLIPLKSNRLLHQSASSHAQYLIRHQKTGHYQKKGSKGYTGNTPSTRVRKVGYNSTIIRENISINTHGYKASVKNLFAAIYHRFTFLNFVSDEIGIGQYHSKNKKAVKNIYVYDLGSSTLSKLCKRRYPLSSGSYYMKDICRDKKKMVPMHSFNKEKEAISLKNAKVVYYPYNKEKDIWPAFYNEMPDPLPQYKVSGFPISVQFNPAYYKKVTLKKFRLYNNKGKEIKKTKILQKKNDANHLFTALEFALMPLARLEFGETYTVVFEAKADKKTIKRKWSFSTTKSKGTYYRLAKNSQSINVLSGSKIILYIVPTHGKDILRSYSCKKNIHAKFLDQNTLEIQIPKQRYSSKLNIRFSNNKRVRLNIKGR
ncbi:putative periplasmic protein [hydrothermal vent metagenome]|uniref:Putative periplasmic protein n=1 Tax=hydrothermal vent metagenome TaxID=652676 RepID=A0A1W1D0Y7_9ZZZZ